MRHFISLDSKITAGGDSIHEIKSLEENYDQPRHIKKQRDIALPTKVRLVKAMVFPVVVYGCELDRKES